MAVASGWVGSAQCLASARASVCAVQRGMGPLYCPLHRHERRRSDGEESRRPERRSVLVRSHLDGSHVQSLVPVAKQTASATHGFLFSLADAATDAATAALTASGDAAINPTVVAESAAQAAESSGGWFSGLANILESFLKVLEQGLTALHVPYAYGFSIILLTVLVKAATYPLSKKQVESSLAMQSLAPKLKAIQAKFAGDNERVQLETARLYKQAGVNPLAGCLPTLATIPIWIGLYQALSNVAKEGVLTEGFFWIPSLAGPTSLAARDSGSGISWLVPFVDGAPPLGWGPTAAYLVLPVLLVASQYYSMQLLQPPSVSDDPAQKNTQLILKFLPVMIGWFALSVPSGLSLYWFTNNLLSTAQTVYLRQMGGAQPGVTSESVAEILEPGQARRSAANAATQEEKDAAKGQRFRELKEAEAQRKAARRAAEEAARAAAIQAAKEREELRQREEQAAAAAAVAASPALGSHQGQGEEEDDDEEDGVAEGQSEGAVVVESALPVKGAAVTANGSARPASRRSKRTRRAKSQ